MSAPPPPGYRYRGLIWPAALIVIGGIALLVNTDVISADRLYRLGDLWPLLLIVIGLELLITRAPLPPNVAAIAAVLILLLAAGGTIAYVAAGAAVPGGTQTMDRSASAGTLDHASLEVDVGGANLKIVGDDIGGDLFRAHIEYTGPAPGVSVDSTTGHVQISQSSGFHFLGPQHFVLAMTVSKNVRWAIAVHSGATSATYDFSKLKLQSLEDDTGASREDIALGTPTGKVPVTINGGALTVNMHRPAGTAAQVEVSGGAVSLTYDGRQQRAVGSLTAGATDSDYFAVRISGGACTMTMDTNQG